METGSRRDEERRGIVLLFPENFPEWARTPEEPRAQLRLVEREGEEDEEPE